MWFNRNKKVNEAVKISPIDDLTMTGAIKFSDVQNPHNQPKPVIEILSIKAFFLSQYSLFNSLSFFKKIFWSILYTWKFIVTEKISFFRFCLIFLLVCILCAIPFLIGIQMISPDMAAPDDIPAKLKLTLPIWTHNLCEIKIEKCGMEIEQFVTRPEGLKKNLSIVYLVVKNIIKFLIPVIIYSVIFIIFFSIPILICRYKFKKVELIFGYIVFFLIIGLLDLSFRLDWSQPLFVYDPKNSLNFNSSTFKPFMDDIISSKHPAIAVSLSRTFYANLFSLGLEDQVNLVNAAITGKPVPQPLPPQLTLWEGISTQFKNIFQFRSDKSQLTQSKAFFDPKVIKYCKHHTYVFDILNSYLSNNEEKKRVYEIMHNNLIESVPKLKEIQKNPYMLIRSYETFKLGMKNVQACQEYYYKGTWMEKIWGGFKVWYWFEFSNYKFPLFSKRLDNPQTLLDWISKKVHSSTTYDLRGVAFSWGRFWDGVVIVVKDVSTLKNWPITVQNFCNNYLKGVKLAITSIDGVLSEYQQAFEHLIKMLENILLDYANYHRFVLNNQGTAFFLTVIAESLSSIVEVEKLIVSIFYFFIICLIYLICIPGAVLLLSNLMSRILDKSVFSKKTTDLSKSSAYECGFQPFSDSRNKIDIRFYLVAILFIIFDLEIMFLFPWSLALSSLTAMGFVSMFCFLLILTLGFFYEWKKKALDW